MYMTETQIITDRFSWVNSDLFGSLSECQNTFLKIYEAHLKSLNFNRFNTTDLEKYMNNNFHVDYLYKHQKPSLLGFCNSYSWFKSTVFDTIITNHLNEKYKNCKQNKNKTVFQGSVLDTLNTLQIMTIVSNNYDIIGDWQRVNNINSAVGIVFNCREYLIICTLDKIFENLDIVKDWSKVNLIYDGSNIPKYRYDLA